MKNFWVIAALLFVSLIYSTGLHTVYGDEKTIELAYLFSDQHEKCKEFGNEEGVLKNTNVFGSNTWKLSGFPHDIMEYLRQSRDIGSAIAPFKYRIVPSLLAKVVSVAFNVSHSTSFLWLNIGFVLLTALLFTYYLMKYFSFSPILSLFGGSLFITMLSTTRTIAFPMIEPASFFFIMLIFIAVKSKNVPLFIASSILGVATKEILAVAGLLWFMNHYEDKPIYKTIAISAIPILAFSVIRLLLGGGALEVNFGHDLAKGDFPAYWTRLLEWGSLKTLVGLVFLSFSFLWLGLINLKKDKFLLRSSIIIPAVVLAAVMLSGQISRVIGVVFPVVIPLFLLLLEKPTEPQH